MSDETYHPIADGDERLLDIIEKAIESEARVAPVMSSARSGSYHNAFGNLERLISLRLELIEKLTQTRINILNATQRLTQ